MATQSDWLFHEDKQCTLRLVPGLVTALMCHPLDD